MFMATTPLAGDLIVRHNAMRNLVSEIAEDGKLSPGEEGNLGKCQWTPPWRRDHPTVGGGSRSRAGHSRDEFRQRVERGVEEPLRVIRAQPQAREVQQGLQGQRDPHLRHPWCGRRSERSIAKAKPICANSCGSPLCAKDESTVPIADACGRLSWVLQHQIAREIELRTNGQKYQYKRDEDEEEDAAEEVADR